MATPTTSGPARSRRSPTAKSTKAAQPVKSAGRSASARASRRAPVEPTAHSATDGHSTATDEHTTEQTMTASEHSAAEHYARNPHHAAEKAKRTTRTRVTIPMLGHVDLPPADELAYIAGIGALAVVGAVEWPVAVVLGAGHALANRRRNKLLREFGEALERA